jgi:hypothetical protein
VRLVALTTNEHLPLQFNGVTVADQAVAVDSAVASKSSRQDVRQARSL